MIDTPHSPVLCEIVGHAQRTPDKIALVDGTQRVSYARLVSMIGATAVYLQSLGLSAGDRILLTAEKEVEFVCL